MTSPPAEEALPMIRLDGVQKVYPNSERPAVDQVSLDIAGGEFLVLLGESGCGKTTLLKMINRLIDHTQGTIEVDGEDISQVDPVLLRRKVGYVFQGIGLFPHMTVGENIAIVPRLLHWETAKISQRIDELLEMVQLAPEQYRHRRPHELSGGQRQRVGVARALAARPKTVLMDEPFGALDPLNRDLLQMEYQQLHQRLEITTVMVTHDITEALILADRIAVMHSGHILQVGTPSELLNSPRHEYVENIMATPKRQADQLEALARGPRT